MTCRPPLDAREALGHGASIYFHICVAIRSPFYEDPPDLLVGEVVSCETLRERDKILGLHRHTATTRIRSSWKKTKRNSGECIQ